MVIGVEEKGELFHVAGKYPSHRNSAGDKHRKSCSQQRDSEVAESSVSLLDFF